MCMCMCMCMCMGMCMCMCMCMQTPPQTVPDETEARSGAASIYLIAPSLLLLQLVQLCLAEPM